MMREFLNIAKALSDENRVRTLMMLSDGELCLCQIIEMLNLAPSTVSKHMSVLFQAQLVNIRKEGKWNYYRLADDVPELITEAIQWTRNCLDNDKQIIVDKKQLKLVCRKNKQEFCKHYKNAKA